MRYKCLIASILLIAAIIASSCSRKPLEGANDDFGSEECFMPPGIGAEYDSIRLKIPFDRPPQLTEFVPPKYPAFYKKQDIEGTVLLGVLINENGVVEGVDLIRSDVPNILNCLAANAAMEFLFLPATRENIPVKSIMTIPIRFKVHSR